MQKAKNKKAISKTPGKSNPGKSKNASPTPTIGATLWLLLLLFGVSFPYDSGLRDPYLSLRFMILAGFLLVGMAGFLVLRKQKISFNHPLTITFIITNILSIIWGIICSSQAINIQESLYVIMRQSLFFITFLIFFILLKQNKISIAGLSKTITVILMLQSLVGILQAYDIAFTSIPGNPHPTGFSGNRNLYASFLPLLLPFAFYTLFINKRPWQIVAGIAITFGLFALILGQTRSAWLAFIISVLVFQVLFILFRKRMSRILVRNWMRMSALGIIGIAFVIGLIFITDQDGSLRERLKNRLVSLYDLSELDATNEAARNVNERLQVWKGTVKMIQNQPLTGIAPGNWRLNFPLYGGMSALKTDEPEELDKVRVQPHNVYLQIASETGIPGLILLLTIGVITIVAAFQNSIKAANQITLLLHFLLLAGIIAFASDMLFSFPQERVEHSVLLMLMTALVFSYSDQNLDTPTHTLQLPVLIFASLVTPFLIFCIILGNAKRKFDFYTMEAIKYETLNQNAKALAVSEAGKSKLVTLDPVSDPMELHTARANLNLQRFDKAMEEILMAERYHPNSHRIYNTKAVIYLKQQKYQEAIDPLKKALRFSPEYKPSLTNLAYSYYRTDQYEASLEVLKKMDIQQDTLLQKLEADLIRRLENEKRDTSNHH